MSWEQKPSPDGSTEGLVTWYDYAGKNPSYPEKVPIGAGTQMPSVIARVLPDGNTWYQYFEYNAIGHQTKMVETYTQPNASIGTRTNTFTYAGNGVDLVLHIGPQGEQVVSNYFGNAYHQVDASYDALNQETKFTYNASRQLTSIHTPGGLTTTNIYFTSGDAEDRLQKTIDLEINRTNSYTYSGDLVYSHTDERGLTVTNYWDGLSRLTGRKYPDGTTTSNIYTALDITATKDRMGFWSYAAYNGIRQKVAETNANGVVTRYGLCDCGALMSITNAWNTPVQLVTSFGYDLQGNRTHIYHPDATVTNWYDSLQRTIVTGDAWGYRWFGYNNQGLLTSITNAYGAEQFTVFDIEDHAIYVTDANGVTITNTYDELHRLRTRTYPDNGVERFGYSSRGLVAYTNQLGYTNFYAYDEAGRKRFETNANWELIRYTNNAAGDLIALVDGKNQVTKWKYDEYGRVTNKLDQAGTEILRYKYDPNSRLTNRWSAAKGTTSYSYDALGNLTFVNYPASPDVSFQYDPLNRVTNMIDAVGTNKYAYALGGQLWTEDGPFADDTVTNSYNNRLRTALSLAQPTGKWTNGFAYDAAKRLTNVTSPAGAFVYQLSAAQPSTLIQKLSLPNTSYITNLYDVNARLLSTTLKSSSHSTLNSHIYAYNMGNQRTQQTFPDTSTTDYTYDKIGQLKIADSSVNNDDRGYVYDAAWNLTRRTNAQDAVYVDTFTVDSLNQLTNAYTYGYYGNHDATYDANGNLTMMNIDHAAFIDTCFYDDENRLQFLMHSESYQPLNWWDSPQNANDRYTEFKYDGLGRLRQRLEYVADSGGSSWQLASETRYIYDGWRVIQERDGSNVPLVSYTRGTDLSGSLEGAGGIGGLLARSHDHSSGNWSTHNFYHADGNGNVTYLVGGSQSLAASYRYDPYGNLISSDGSLANDN
ncbi:MAG TPA: hypothetical protein VFZ59_20365, partial [Verrucomicrobiae bacterium]|nr:hypothetical protein [Verrucomicrobiae bacterium]